MRRKFFIDIFLQKEYDNYNNYYCFWIHNYRRRNTMDNKKLTNEVGAPIAENENSLTAVK